MRNVLVALVVVLTPAMASAQGHPCDAAVTSQVIQSGAPHSVGFCSPESDDVEAVVVYVDGQPYDLVPITSLSGPNAVGLVFYRTVDIIQVARGTHVVEVAAYNRKQFDGTLQLGPKSPPFSFAADDEKQPPTSPFIKEVSR